MSIAAVGNYDVKVMQCTVDQFLDCSVLGCWLLQLLLLELLVRRMILFAQMILLGFTLICTGNIVTMSCIKVHGWLAATG